MACAIVIAACCLLGATVLALALCKAAARADRQLENLNSDRVFQDE